MMTARDWTGYRDDGMPRELTGTDDDVCGFVRDSTRTIVRRKVRGLRRRRPAVRVRAHTIGDMAIPVSPADCKNLAPLTGQEIRAIRKSVRLTQSKFAAFLGVREGYVGERENSPHPLTRGTMLARLHAIRRGGRSLLP